MQDLIIWLCNHEQDIADDINDFGDLQQVFMEAVGRVPGQELPEDPIW
jgi:hypothetical protein